MSVALYKSRLGGLEKKLAQREAERNVKQQDLDLKNKELERIAIKSDQLEQVVKVLTKTADQARKAGKERMEKVVTRALQSVFGPDFSFEIDLDESGGKPVANFYVVTPDPHTGESIRNEPQSSRGGGINDIVSLALQVATMVVYNEPKLQGPIILDEPGKHISEDYIVKFGAFLDFISRTFNRQITMVTHQAHLSSSATKSLISQMVSGSTTIVPFVQKYDDEDESDETLEEEAGVE